MRAYCLALMMAATTLPTTAHAAPANVKASVAATAVRTEANVKLDASRKPAEVLTFLGLKKGMRVSDMFGGNFYWAEIIAPSVGPKGRVSIWQPQQFYSQKVLDRYNAYKAKQPNVWMRMSPFEAPDLQPATYDFMLINLDYHDVYWQSPKYGITPMEPRAWLSAIYAAMKPGGIVGVVDHIGPPGDTRAIVEKLHRIDPAVVKADFERAGFVLDRESDILRNPADDHSLLVFDPAIRGKTDRFVYRYKRPR